MMRLLRRLRLADSYGLNTLGVLTLGVAGAVGFLAAMVLILLVCMRSYGSGVCHSWSTATGVQSRFVVLGFMDSGTCLARTPEGVWVKNTDYLAIVRGGGGR